MFFFKFWQTFANFCYHQFVSTIFVDDCGLPLKDLNLLRFYLTIRLSKPFHSVPVWNIHSKQIGTDRYSFGRRQGKKIITIKHIEWKHMNCFYSSWICVLSHDVFHRTYYIPNRTTKAQTQKKNKTVVDPFRFCDKSSHIIHARIQS